MFARLKQALFRWHSDGAQPIVLTQRRIFILPTRAGIFFALVLLTLLIGAINYNLALGYALVFLLCGLMVVDMVHTFRNLYQLEFIAGQAEAVFAGETAIFPLHARNHRPETRPALCIQIAEHTLREHVPARGQTRFALPLASVRRGRLKLPRLKLSTTYPLGLFRAWSYLHPEMDCLIYPHPADDFTPPWETDGTHGETRPQSAQQGDFSGLREWQPADSRKHLAWKAIARRPAEAPLLSKAFHSSGGTETWLSLDETNPGLNLEERLSILCAALRAAEAAGHRYGLRLGEHSSPLNHGKTHVQQCLGMLACYEAD